MPLLTNGPSRLLGGRGAKWYRAGGAPAPIAAYQPKGAADLAASYINLANPGTNDCTAPTAAPTFATATGWTFDGTQYLTTGVVPSTGYSMIVRWASARDATNRGMIGIRADSVKRFNICAIWSANSSVFSHSATVANPANTATSGTYAITQAGYYIDGAKTAWSPAAFVGDVGIQIGAVPGLGDKYAGSILAVAIYNTTLSDAQITALVAAIAAL